MDLFQADRHEVRPACAWNEGEARRAIEEIVSAACDTFRPDTLFPSHPSDAVPGGTVNLYFGAAGTILALDHLKRAGAVDYAIDFAAHLPEFAERDAVWLMKSPMGAYASLLMSDLGPFLTALRLRCDGDWSGRILERVARNDLLPPLELMWGTPGSMLALVHAYTLTGDPRFPAAFRRQAARLIAHVETLDGVPLWTQTMFGRQFHYLGLVHGFAGNLLALIQGWRWLTEDQRGTVAALATQTITMTAQRAEHGECANWPANADYPYAPMFVQICHGAPGILAGLADAPFSTPAFERSLLEGGELVHRAGALCKGANFCHGTGGNAYALLKLYQRTRDPKWLHCARELAMVAIDQMRDARAQHGQYRHSLWTGDPGLAVCLWSCVTGRPGFPALDSI